MSAPLTFVEQLRLRFLPRSLATHIAAKALACARDRIGSNDENNEEQRKTAIRCLGNTSYAGDFYDAFIELATDITENRYVRHMAILELQYQGANTRKALNGDDEERRTDGLTLLISGKYLVKKPIDFERPINFDIVEEDYRRWAVQYSDIRNERVISAIATVLRDKSESFNFRSDLLPMIELMPQDSAYLIFTNALIDIILDSTQDSTLRCYAVWRLDPVIHKDVLLRVIDDADVIVRNGAIWMLNNASIKQAGGRGK